MARVPAFFLALGEAIHATESGTPGLFRGEALRDELLRTALQMVLQLFFELLLHLAAAEEGS